jgi:DNA-binding transcriptional ArsR family regulator
MNSRQINQIHNNIDRVIHEPVRLAILKILSGVKEVDFNFLLATLGVTKGNLASHISRLQEAKLADVKKEFVGKIPHTSYRITRKGRSEFEKYWENMKELAPE